MLSPHPSLPPYRAGRRSAPQTRAVFHWIRLARTRLHAESATPPSNLRSARGILHKWLGKWPSFVSAAPGGAGRTRRSTLGRWRGSIASVLSEG